MHSVEENVKIFEDSSWTCQGPVRSDASYVRVLSSIRPWFMQCFPSQFFSFSCCSTTEQEIESRTTLYFLISEIPRDQTILFVMNISYPMILRWILVSGPTLLFISEKSFTENSFYWKKFLCRFWPLGLTEFVRHVRNSVESKFLISEFFCMNSLFTKLRCRLQDITDVGFNRGYGQLFRKLENSDSWK